jgi:hypothetical protein
MEGEKLKEVKREREELLQNPEMLKYLPQQEESQRERERKQEEMGQEKKRVIPMSKPQPSVITNCDGAGCWDEVGNRYNKAAGNTYFRGDGKICQGVGGNMQCN